MSKRKEKELNNKGFSLLEVLVALAITGIVATLVMTLISTSSSMFHKESNTLDIQNQLQETSNKINDVLQEATSLTMTSTVAAGQSVLVIYNGTDVVSEEESTAEGDEETVDASTDKIIPRYIIWFKPSTGTGSIYIINKAMYPGIDHLDELLTEGSDYEGYCLTEYVKDMVIEIDDSCYGTAESGAVDESIVNQPLILNISLSLENRDEVKFDSKTVTLRNSIKALHWDGEDKTLE